MKIKQLSVRMDEYLLFKLRIVAEEEDRSVNGQIVFLIRKYIQEYEAKNGKISV